MTVAPVGWAVDIDVVCGTAITPGLRIMIGEVVLATSGTVSVIEGLDESSISATCCS